MSQFLASRFLPSGPVPVANTGATTALVCVLPLRPPLLLCVENVSGEPRMLGLSSFLQPDSLCLLIRVFAPLWSNA